MRIILAEKEKPHDVKVRISILKIMVKYHSPVRVSRSWYSYHVSFKLVVVNFFPSFPCSFKFTQISLHATFDIISFTMRRWIIPLSSCQFSSISPFCQYLYLIWKCHVVFVHLSTVDITTFINLSYVIFCLTNYSSPEFSKRTYQLINAGCLWKY